MVQFYDSISDDLRDWALQQQVFFIASAPLTGKHVNLSPKGLPASTLTVFDKNHVGYIDATGSGIETISHVYENGRATITFCSFDKSPRIMRWFCTGKVVEWDNAEFECSQPRRLRWAQGCEESGRRKSAARRHSDMVPANDRTMAGYAPGSSHCCRGYGHAQGSGRLDESENAKQYSAVPLTCGSVPPPGHGIFPLTGQRSFKVVCFHPMTSFTTNSSRACS